MHKVLVNPLVKLAQEKVWLGELTVVKTIAVHWDVKPQAKQTNKKKAIDVLNFSILIIQFVCG